MTDGDRPTVGVDVDGVLAEFVRVARDGVEATEGVEVAEEDVRQDKWVRDDVDVGVHEAHERTLENDQSDEVSTFPDDLDVVDGTREGLAALAEEHEVVVVTSRPEESEEGTRQWLEDDDLTHDELRMAGSKELEPDLDVPVDDHLWNVQKFTGLGPHPEDPEIDARPGVVFDRPWSTRHVDVDDHGTTGAVRVEGEDTATQCAKTVGAVESLLRGEDIEAIRAAANDEGVVDSVEASAELGDDGGETTSPGARDDGDEIA